MPTQSLINIIIIIIIIIFPQWPWSVRSARDSNPGSQCTSVQTSSTVFESNSQYGCLPTIFCAVSRSVSGLARSPLGGGSALLVTHYQACVDGQCTYYTYVCMSWPLAPEMRNEWLGRRRWCGIWRWLIITILNPIYTSADRYRALNSSLSSSSKFNTAIPRQLPLSSICCFPFVWSFINRGMWFHVSAVFNLCAHGEVRWFPHR